MEKLFDIIHEDDDLLVINKPAGLVCHPTKNGEMSSLIGRVRLHLKVSPPQLSTISQPHLINRLDRETGGVVIIAKNSVIAGELGKIFESRSRSIKIDLLRTPVNYTRHHFLRAELAGGGLPESGPQLSFDCN